MQTGFVLLWFALSGPGVMTSGSADFETKEACQKAEQAMRGHYVKLGVKVPTSASPFAGIEISCQPKR